MIKENYHFFDLNKKWYNLYDLQIDLSEKYLIFIRFVVCPETKKTEIFISEGIKKTKIIKGPYYKNLTITTSLEGNRVYLITNKNGKIIKTLNSYF